MKKTIDDILKISSDTNIEDILQSYANSNEYFEIFIQLIQTNINGVYKYLNDNNYNKINELIIDIKLRRNYMKSNNNSTNNINKYVKTMLDQGKYIDDNGFIQNMTSNEMKYSLYNPSQNEKLGTYDTSFTNKWNDDYVLLNTDKWRPPFSHHIYRCKTNDNCAVCPTMTKGYPVSVKEFNMARKILPPDIINIDYINEKLNTGLS